MAIAQSIKASKLTNSQIPITFKFKGSEIQEVWQWTDTEGEKILVASVDNPVKEIDYRQTKLSARIHVFIFQKNGKQTYDQIFEFRDGELGCTDNFVCGFVKNSITITDLDNNGIGEVTFIYKTGCREKSEPVKMTLEMHEGFNQTYSLWGETWVNIKNNNFNITEKNVNLEKLSIPESDNEIKLQKMGRYNSEEKFIDAPASFLSYAKKQWLKFVVEKL